jgi:integrative and conjugative element protein (TIGR02256 family)
VCTDGWLLQRLIELRQGKLPNETGGVLVGSFDMQRKIVYIVDTIPSPSDSKEWPTVYIRGFQGLSNQMENINKLTNGGLEYVGEWHSHPDGYGCLPSVDDQKAFVSLKEHMAMEGKPVLMLIVGATNQIGWYLGQMG